VRIALVLPSLVGGGAERVFLDIARGLLNQAVAVDVVTVRDEGPLRGNVPSEARLRVLGAGHVAASVPALARYLRRERPDAVISALSHTNLACIAACRLVRPRVPLVVTQHNHLSTVAGHAPARRDRWMPRFIHHAYPWADRVVAVSQGVADDLALTARLPRSDIEVAYNPVLFPELLAASEEPLSHPTVSDERGPLLLGVGRLHQQKDFATLLRALALLPSPWRLVILGEGEERQGLERLAHELEVHDRLELPGFVANPYPYYRHADVFVLSSLWEGLPTALIEALPFRAAIVSTDCNSGPREILDGGRWGRLVPTSDPAALASAAMEALADPPLDRSRAMAPFSLDVVTRRYLDLLPRLEVSPGTETKARGGP